MDFDVRCRFCGDVELMGPLVCKSCQKTLLVGALIGGALLSGGYVSVVQLLKLLF